MFNHKMWYIKERLKILERVIAYQLSSKPATALKSCVNGVALRWKLNWSKLVFHCYLHHRMTLWVHFSFLPLLHKMLNLLWNLECGLTVHLFFGFCQAFVIFHLDYQFISISYNFTNVLRRCSETFRLLGRLPLWHSKLLTGGSLLLLCGFLLRLLRWTFDLVD